MGLFGVGCFVTSIPWGWYTDRSTSRRTPFLLGLLLLLIATILLWVAPRLADASIPIQVVARLLQGLASTVVWTTGFAVLVDAVGQEHIGEASGYIGIALNAGSITAPLLGGIVFAKSGYDAVFALILSVVAVDILFRLVMKERPRTEKGEPDFDTVTDPEALKKQMIIEITPVASSMNSSEEDLIKALPQKSTTSRLPGFMRLLFSVRFLVALWGIVMLASTFSGIETILPLAVKSAFGWNSMGSGLIFLPLSVPAVLGPVVGKLTDRFGVGRWFAGSAFLVLCPTLIALRFVQSNSMNQKALLCILLAIVGLCLTMILEPLFAEVTLRAGELEKEDISARNDNSKHPGYYAQAYAHFNMAWALGNVLGPLVAGLLVDAAGWKTATLALGLFCGGSAIPVTLWCTGFIVRKG